MKIGMIGAGHIGSALARHFADAGHDVAISNSRGPETLRELEAELGPRVEAMTAEDAARFGEVVVVSVPFKAYQDVPAEPLAGEGSRTTWRVSSAGASRTTRPRSCPSAAPSRACVRPPPAAVAARSGATRLRRSSAKGANAPG